MAQNILGSTTDTGVGSNRKSGIPRFQASNTKLNTGGNMQGVGLGTGRISLGAGGSVKAPKLQARNIAPFVQETPQADLPVISERAVQQGMTDLASSVEQYSDDVAELQAKQAMLQLNSGLRTLFYGDSENRGFREAEGSAALGGYRDYSKQVDELVSETLHGLSPYARQKAVMAAFSKRDSYLNVASEHVVNEKDKLDEMSRQVEREDVLRDIITDPRQVLGTTIKDENGKMVFTPSRLKDQYFSTFRPDQYSLAVKGWNKMLLSAADEIHFSGRSRIDKDGNFIQGTGIEDVKAFAATVGVTELSKDTLLALNKQISKWVDQENADFVRSERYREAKENKAIAQRQNTVSAGLHVELYDVNAQEKSVLEVYKMAERGEITQAQANNYEVAYRRKNKVKSEDSQDVKTALMYRKRIADLGDSGYKDSEWTSLIEEASTDEQLGDKTGTVVSLMYSHRNATKKKNYSRAVKHIDLAIEQSYRKTDQYDSMGNLKVVKTNTSDRLELAAIEEYEDLIDEDWEHSKALDYVVKKYRNKDEQFLYLPNIPRYGKPGSVEEFNSVCKKVKQDLTSGVITQEEYNAAHSDLVDYKDYFLKHSTTSGPSKVAGEGRN